MNRNPKTSFHNYGDVLINDWAWDTYCEDCGERLLGVHDLFCERCLYWGELRHYLYVGTNLGTPRGGGRFRVSWTGKKKRVFSRKFLECLVLHELPQYRICQLADVSYGWLWRARNGVVPIWGLDERAIRLGAVLGLEKEEILVEKGND